MQRIEGFSQQGNTIVSVSGLPSTNKVQGSFPLAIVTVYLHGTITPASIYSDDNATPTPLGNPFTSNSNGTFGFYAPNGRYDIVFSGAGQASPITLSDVVAGLGNSGLPSYVTASLPGAGTPNVGNLARVTDGIRGIWEDTGTQWIGINGEKVYSKDFGAIGQQTGVDDAPAIQAAIAAAIAATYTSTAGGYSSSTSLPSVWFPRGVYTINSSISGILTSLDGLILEGDDATFEVASGVTFLPDVNYGIKVRGINIRGGLTAFSTTSNNLDVNMIFENCGFYQQTGPSFNNTMQSPTIIFSQCRFANSTSTGSVLTSTAGAQISFRDTAVTCSATAQAAFDVTGTFLILDNVVGVSAGALYAFVVQRAATTGTVTIANSRLGFDGGGGSAGTVINYAVAQNIFNNGSNTSIIIRDTLVFNNGPLLYLYGIPNMIDCTGLTGLAGNTPVVVDGSVSSANLAQIGSFVFVSKFHFEFNSTDYGSLISPASPVIAREGLPLVEDGPIVSSRPNTADLIYQTSAATGSYTPTSSSTSATLATGTDEFGVVYSQITATAAGGTGQYNFTSALSGLSAGVYTAVFMLDVTTSTAMQLHLQASNVNTAKPIVTKGKYCICVPFYYDGGASQTIGLTAVNMPNAGVIRWHRWIILAGRFQYSGQRLELDGTAPISTQSYRGDKVYNTNKTVATQANSWSCFTSGVPGLWAADRVGGTFTMTGSSATTVVSDTNAVNNGTISLVSLTALNTSASALIGSAACPKLVAAVTGVSFTIQTGNASNAAGTEQFQYVLQN